MVLQKLDANHFCPPFIAGIPHWIWTFVRSISTCFAASRAESNPKREENGWILLDSVQGTSKPSWHPGNSKNRWSNMWTGNSSFCWTRLVTNSNCKVLLRLVVVDQKLLSCRANKTVGFAAKRFFSTSPLSLSHFLSSPQFSHGQKAKNASNILKTLQKRLLLSYTMGWYHTSSQPLGINLIQ